MFKKLLLSLCLTSLIAWTVADIKCPDNYLLVGNKCYTKQTTTEEFDWFQAIRKCKQTNANLLTIENSQEMKNLIENLKNLFPADIVKPKIWTAGTDMGSHGRYYWQSIGINMRYTKWMKLHPYFHSKPNERCVQLYFNEKENDYYMLDVKCKLKMHYICEIPAEDEATQN